MNKFIKLPLFLGICGAACGVVLAGINSLTADQIQRNKETKANAGYLKMYEEFGVTIDHLSDAELTADLTAAGCSAKKIVLNDSVKGITYTCEVQGYGGAVSFQVAFGNGQYIGYTDLGNTETSGYGKDLISSLPELIKGIDSNKDLATEDPYKSAMSGKSVTGKAIASCINVCASDYNAWYATV